MTVVQVADTLFRNLGQPTNLSIPKIAYDLRYIFLGKLNILIDTEIALDSNLDFDPELTHDQSSIMQELYYINYYDKLINNNLGANSYELNNDWISLQEGDSKITRANFVDKARLYRDLQKEHKIVLDNLIGLYRMNHAHPKDERYYNC